MSNSPFTDDDEWLPQGGVCVLCGTGVDHRHHGVPVGLGPGEAGLCCCQHAGGESNSGIGDDRPVRDQQGTAAGVEECLRQS